MDHYREFADRPSTPEDEEETQRLKIQLASKNEVALNVMKFPKKKITDLNVSDFADANEYVSAKDAEEGHLLAYSYLDYYTYKYNKLLKVYPHVYRNVYVNISKMLGDLFKYIEIPENSFVKSTYHESSVKKGMVSSMLIRFSKDVVMYISGYESLHVLYNPADEKNENSVFHTLMGILRTYKLPNVIKNKIYIVYRTSHGFERTGFDVKNLNINIDENYNDDFKETSEVIVNGLNDKKKTNLVILHGEPGTGKCVIGNTKITVRDKKTGEIKEMNIEDLI